MVYLFGHFGLLKDIYISFFLSLSLSYHLEIEIHRYAFKSMEEQICQSCHQRMLIGRTLCQCIVCYERKGRYHCLFKQGFGPLFLQELKRHMEKL